MTDGLPGWCARSLRVPLIAFAGAAAGGLSLSLALFAVAVFLVTIALELLYRRDPLTQVYTELARARGKAATDVKKISGKISSTQREVRDVERAESRLANRHTKARAALKTDFDRRQQKVPNEIKSIDGQLNQLSDQKQRTIARQLTQHQQVYINSALSQAEISASNVPGVGAQLVEKLRSTGIRSAADFTGLDYASSGGPPAVSFRLSSGRLAHIAGIGKVKAERIDQWRQAHVANAMISQPSALPALEMSAIVRQFSTQERQLRDRRARATSQNANQVAGIQQELNTAQIEMDKRYQAELTSLGQRKAALAAQLGQVHADHLAAQQLVVDWDSRMTSAGRLTFSRFVSSALRGRLPT